MEKDVNSKIESALSRLDRGVVLLSSENLKDPNFEITVILICVHNAEGTFGLVLNRPSHMPLTEVFDSLPEHFKTNRTIYIGGPVEPEGLHLIQLTTKGVDGSYSVAPGVYLGGDWESLEDILTSDPNTTRLFLGYSGWAPGQLEDEIETGDWEVFSVADPAQFLSLWNEPLFSSIKEIRDHLTKMALESEL